MDSKPITQKASLKAIGMFIAAILLTSVFLVSVGNVAADADLVDPAALNATRPAGPGGATFGAAGGILLSWNNTLAWGWGVGYDCDDHTVWISDIGSNDNIEFHTGGTPTGRRYSTAAWVASWPADMEYDRTRAYMYQVNVCGDGCIYAWDINTGNVMAVICDPAGTWNSSCQRGVAYRETDDTLWVGGWIDNTIYHIKGLSWDNPGEVLDLHFDPTIGIAGLAWHCDGYLYVTGSSPAMVYVLTDDGGYAPVESYPLPSVGTCSGVGADIDWHGNLWAGTIGGTIYNSMTYLLDTDRPADCCPPPLVGGEADPIDKATVLAPWIGSVLAIVAGGAYLVRRRALASK